MTCRESMLLLSSTFHVHVIHHSSIQLFIHDLSRLFSTSMPSQAIGSSNHRHHPAQISSQTNQILNLLLSIYCFPVGRIFLSPYIHLISTLSPTLSPHLLLLPEGASEHWSSLQSLSVDGSPRHRPR